MWVRLWFHQVWQIPRNRDAIEDGSPFLPGWKDVSIFWWMLQGWNNSTYWRWLKLVKRYCYCITTLPLFFLNRCCLWHLCFRMVTRGVAHWFTTIVAKNTPAFLVDVFWKQWSLIGMLIYQKPLLFSLVFPPCWCEHRWKSCMVKHLFGPFLDLTC